MMAGTADIIGRTSGGLLLASDELRRAILRIHLPAVQDLTHPPRGPSVPRAARSKIQSLFSSSVLVLNYVYPLKGVLI
jgi:hypothetical protein